MSNNFTMNNKFEIWYINYHFIVQLVIPVILLMYFYMSMFMTLSRTSKKRKYLSEGSSTEQKKETELSKISYAAEKSIIKIEKDPLSHCGTMKILNQQTRKKTVTYSKMKTLKLTLCIVVSFLFCTIPFYIGVYCKKHTGKKFKSLLFDKFI